MIIRSPIGQNKYKGEVDLEICNKTDKGFIEVWLTKEEQETVDRNEITARLLEGQEKKKVKVVFFMSGEEELYPEIEGLLLTNLGCV